MDFNDLKNVFAVSSGEFIDIDIATLSPNIAELLVQCYGGERLTILVGSIIIDDDHETISIDGTSKNFLSDDLTALPVFLTAQVDKAGQAQLLIKYRLPDDWKFSDSFPKMPMLGADHVLDSMVMSDCLYIVTSRDKYDFEYNGKVVTLSSGINFLGKMMPTGVLCIMGYFLDQQKPLTISGNIHRILIADPFSPLDPLDPVQYPWNVRNVLIPGILLNVDLDLKLDITEKISLSNVVMKMYMPTDYEWLNSNPRYLPIFAYTGSVALGIQSEKKIGYTALFDPNGDNVLLTMDMDLSISDVAQLVDFTGSIGKLEEKLKIFGKVLDSIQLLRVGFAVRVSEKKLVVDNASITIGANLDWEIWNKPQFMLKKAFLDLFVAEPFSDAKSRVDICLRGKMSVGKVDFNVMASSSDDLTVIAEIDENVDISLLAFMQTYAHEIPALPDLMVNRFKIAVSPSNYYHIIVTMAEKPKWVIEIGYRELTISDVLLDFKYEAKTRRIEGRFSGKIAFGKIAEFDVSYKLGTEHVVDIKWTKLCEFPLYKILKYIGVDVPESVALRLGDIPSAELSYNITEKVLSIHANENIEFTIGPDKYKIVAPIISELSLSRLPVVGKILPLPNSLVIDELVLVASSIDCKYKEVDVLSGAALYCTINKNPIALQIYHKKDTLSLIGNSNTELLLTDTFGAESAKWININKTFGIFGLHRFGLSFNNNKIAFLLDASLSAKPIGLNLMGLGLSTALTDPSNPDFHLSGLGASFDNGTIALNGAFMKSPTKESYDGQIAIKMQNFSLLAIGTYGKDYLLVYAVLNAPIGGPPAFFITGIAAGFGYNCDLNIPEIDQIADFPLISAVMGKFDDNMLTKLTDHIEPHKGQLFLAAGVKFTSFQMIESFALFTVTFGQYTAINVLGLSQVSIPPNLKTGTPPRVYAQPLVYAQLALKATFLPSEGIFSLAAQLTSESYILSKDCKLCGGFAFYAWFAGKHAGDFVLTLGGYPSNYKKPPHYPSVPRLGISWNITKDLSVNGDLYFALTPSRLMAGGRLNALYEHGAIKAWFTVTFDLDIAWKPFHYNINLFANFGVSIKIKVASIHKTLKLEFSSNLHIWGPEFSGTAEISLYFTSFTIKFGVQTSQTNTITWTEFSESFLPKATTPVQNKLKDQLETIQPIAIAVSNGLLKEETIDKIIYTIVRADSLELLIKSAIPSTEITANNTALNLFDTPADIGVLPMGITKLTSCLTVELTKDGTPLSEDSAGDPIEWAVVYENLPSALWRSTKPDKDEPISHVATGLCIRPKKIPRLFFPKGDKYFDLSEIYIPVPADPKCSWNKGWMPKYAGPDDSIETFSKTVLKAGGSRNSFIDHLGKVGFLFKEKIDLEKLAEQAARVFSEEMLLGAIV
ncbi:MAG: hypothetical protein LBH74_09470 [Nitrososphaerota archaeon]|jgi:hypothetical protein|nr:hypothetical protein [Nitrososphaerota archaeon]